MGIRFSCPNGHKLNVKDALAGKRALCPDCGAKVQIPEFPQPSAGASAPAAGVPSTETPTATVPDSGKAATNTPSIVIPLDTSPTSVYRDVPPTPPVPPPLPATLVSPTSVRAVELPSTVVVPAKPPMVTPPAPLPPDVQYQIHRQRRRRNQVMLAIALLVMVVVLGIGLIFVLWRNSKMAPSEQKPAVQTGGVFEATTISLASVSVSLPPKTRSEQA